MWWVHSPGEILLFPRDIHPPTQTQTQTPPRVCPHSAFCVVPFPSQVYAFYYIFERVNSQIISSLKGKNEKRNTKWFTVQNILYIYYVTAQLLNIFGRVTDRLAPNPPSILDSRHSYLCCTFPPFIILLYSQDLNDKHMPCHQFPYYTLLFHFFQFNLLVTKYLRIALYLLPTQSWK